MGKRTEGKEKGKMAECIITMQTLTYAEKAKRAAQHNGIHGTVVNIDPSVTGRGCAYGISLDCGEAERFAALLKRKGIPYGEIVGGRK